MSKGVPASTEKLLGQVTLLWRPLEQAALGLINGAIMVLSLLLATGSRPAAPFKAAIVLFGSVMAMTLARVLAELVAHSIATGAPMLTHASVRTAWKLCYPVLGVVMVPVLLFWAAGHAWLPITHAIILSQGFCVAILVVLGARVGWVISKDVWHPLLGAAGAGGIGIALAAIYYAVH